MDLQRPPATRPAEHLLHAHRAHAASLGELDGAAEGRLREAASSVGAQAQAAAAPKPRARRKGKS